MSKVEKIGIIGQDSAALIAAMLLHDTSRYEGNVIVNTATAKVINSFFPNKEQVSNIEEKAKVHGRFNRKKHLATCAKNRKKRKSKKRK